MFFKKKKKEYFYEQFTELGEYAIREMDILVDGLKNFDSIDLDELKRNVHALEHEADKKKKNIEEKLAKEFITPIDREDIFVLLDEIDDLNDAIDEISYKLYMRNYKVLPENYEVFMDKSKECILALFEVLKAFPQINKKEVMDPLIKNVLTIEEDVDKIYEYYVHKLYTEGKDYEMIRLGERVYNYFEYVTDKCRDICKTVLIIMYKNL